MAACHDASLRERRVAEPSERRADGERVNILNPAMQATFLHRGMQTILLPGIEMRHFGMNQNGRKLE